MDEQRKVSEIDMNQGISFTSKNERHEAAIKGDSDYSDDRRDGDDRFSRASKGKVFYKKRACKFCTQKIKVDYKDIDTMRRLVTERGKILPRRLTGTCAKHQRVVAVHIKRARALAYLPYVSR